MPRRPLRIAYFDCYSGISGDMILAALVDLGVDLRKIRSALKSLPLGRYQIKSGTIRRGLVSGTKVDVHVPHSRGAHSHSRTFTEIKRMIEDSNLPDSVKTASVEIFDRIAVAESEVHSISKNQVHFHEVGAVDSIVDIVGGSYAIELLNVDRIISSPLNVGEGFVECEHGILPVPAPATLKLLKGIPCFSSGVKKEMTTPTGAAMIGYFSREFKSLPPMKILQAGYGAGDHIIDQSPNMLRVILGETGDGEKQETLCVVETNIDDMNPELFQPVMESLFKAGAVDVYFSSIVMKKNRPATQISALVAPDRREKVARILLRETTTFGVRFYEVERMTLDRQIQTLVTPLGKVRIKFGRLGGEILHIAPEFDDCRKIAKTKNLPVKQVYDEVRRFADSVEWKNFT